MRLQADESELLRLDVGAKLVIPNRDLVPQLELQGLGGGGDTGSNDFVVVFVEDG